MHILKSQQLAVGPKDSGLLRSGTPDRRSPAPQPSAADGSPRGPGTSRDMRKFYPMMVDLTGKRCLVVGGGAVAERKVVLLVECGAGFLQRDPLSRPHFLARDQRFDRGYGHG